MQADTSEIIQAELNGCLIQNGMQERKDINQIEKKQMHNVYFSTFSVTPGSISYQKES